MKVTDKQYYLNEQLNEKVLLMIERLNKIRDMLLFIDGYEGYGKTTLSVEICYYVAELTKRSFNVDNIFFNVDKMIDFASKTEKQIILWDEAILGGLATEWRSQSQLKLRKLLGVARKKSHFFVFNIPRFYQLAQPIIDRAIGLVHVFSPDEIKMGYFCYYNKSSLMNMYNAWRSTKRIYYNKFYNFRGRFYDSMYNKQLINIQAYEDKKDEAIMSINDDSKKEPNRIEKRAIELKWRFANSHEIDNETKARIANTTIRSIQKWRNLDQKYPFLLKDVVFGVNQRTIFLEREGTLKKSEVIPELKVK